jgi:hypothetical protein
VTATPGNYVTVDNATLTFPLMAQNRPPDQRHRLMAAWEAAGAESRVDHTTCRRP